MKLSEVQNVGLPAVSQRLESAEHARNVLYTEGLNLS